MLRNRKDVARSCRGKRDAVNRRAGKKSAGGMAKEGGTFAGDNPPTRPDYTRASIGGNRRFRGRRTLPYDIVMKRIVSCLIC